MPTTPRAGGNRGSTLPELRLEHPMADPQGHRPVAGPSDDRLQELGLPAISHRAGPDMFGPGPTRPVIVREADKYLAATADCNSLYCKLDPREGARIAVAEAARNLVCSGATPLAVTDNLNFGNPYHPEIFWQLREAVEGLAEASAGLARPSPEATSAYTTRIQERDRPYSYRRNDWGGRSGTVDNPAAFPGYFGRHLPDWSCWARTGCEPIYENRSRPKGVFATSWNWGCRPLSRH